jgi:hypothetical protein
VFAEPAKTPLLELDAALLEPPEIEAEVPLAVLLLPDNIPA